VQITPQGYIPLPQGPGRGFKIKQDLVEKLTVRKKQLTSRE
jgi:L-alanine-DL-glutamate epimerase-like enolase superfamily enzyme